MIVLGLILIPLYEDTGAAVAAVVGETILMLLLLFALARSDRTLFPSFAFAWRVALPAAVAVVPFFVPLGPIVAAVIATALFAAGIWVTGVLPPEVAHALLGRVTNGQKAPRV